MADDTWRYAEPDGKQRALSLDDLQRSLARGLLPTNVPVWHSGFADWTPASDVPELRASVASGARIIPAKGAQRPGRPVAQRGGAAAQGEEPMSPPSYSPARKARPAAPALDLNKTQVDAPAAAAEEPMRSRASTLLLAGGAPGRDRNPESEATPINVPSPGGANEAPNTITRPPPISDGAVVPNIPSSSGKVKINTAPASGPDVDDQAETREMPAAMRATLRDDAWDIPDEPPMSSGVIHDVSSSMLLPDSGSVSVPQVVSTSMLLPDDNSSGTLPDAGPSSEKSPVSTEEIREADVISAREPEVKRPTMPPPLRASRPSHPAIGASLRPSSPGFPSKSRPSFPSRSEVEGHTPPPPAADGDVADRIGLRSKPPPPDINPLSSDFPPPPGVPAEALDEDKTDPSLRKRREAERKSAAPEATSKPVVPLWGAIAAVVVVAGGVWVVAKGSGNEEPPSPGAASSSSVAPVLAPVAVVDAGSTSGVVVCKLTSSARPILEDVLQPAGLELATTGSRVAIGFAKSSREAVAVELDPASLAKKDTVTSKSTSDINRVVPRFEGDKLVALPESADMTKGVSLQRRAGDVVLGVSKSKLVRLPATGAPEELFTLPSANVDALRIAQLPGSKTDAAYTYRAPGSVWLGTTQKSDSPQRIPGLGPQVGSPTVVALDSKNLIATWADRASDAEPWGLRIAAYSPGKGNFTPKKYAGKGDGAMLSPALVRIDATHALLLWTQEHSKAGDADTKTYEVLAQTLDAKGAPLGEPFAVSAADMSGGQPQGVMDDNGKGTIAFLVANGDVYDVAVAGVGCK